MPTIEVPVPPSANRYWRNWHGRMVKSKEARAYGQLVAATVRSKRGWLIKAPTAVAVYVIWMRNEKRGDLDNRLKVVLDALSGIAWEDDSQIDMIQATRFQMAKPSKPRMVIEWRARNALTPPE